jgi:arsenate reductase (thioredoxin)
MAAALTHHLSQDRIGVRSAGSMPGEQIHPIVVEAMREIGVDVHQEFPKPLSDEVVRAADVVITMGCGDACPLYPGKHYEDWDVADPEAQPIETVRAIRQDIAQRVEALVDSLVPAGTSA